MTHRSKLELSINKPVTVELLFDEPIKGESQYGNYSMYALSVKGVEYSYFAPDEVHTELFKLKKGDIATITKLAEQRGNKVVTTYKVETPSKVKTKAEFVSIGDAINEILPDTSQEDHLLPNNPSKTDKTHVEKDAYYKILKQSYADALEINSSLNGITADVARLCITLFIARSKTI